MMLLPSEQKTLSKIQKKKYKRKEGKKWEGERKETTLYVWAREVPSTWQAKCV